MMSEMLMNSITPEAKTQVEVFRNEYEFSDGGVPGDTVTVAAALYKVIMKLTTMDDKSTNTALREAINDLPEYAVAVNGDITKINTYFDTKYAQLKARGGNIDDKESLLFKTYANVPDGEFKDWVKLRKDDWFAERNEMKGGVNHNGSSSFLFGLWENPPGDPRRHVGNGSLVQTHVPPNAKSLPPPKTNNTIPNVFC